jgi:hypothetical protein
MNGQSRDNGSSGLSIPDWSFGFLWRLFVLCLVYPVLPLSLGCLFLISPSVFSDACLSCVLYAQCYHCLWIEQGVHKTQDKRSSEKTERTIMNGQSRDNGSTGYTRHRTNRRQRKPKDQSWMDNPETMVALGTQDIGQISVRENRRTNQEWTIQRQW